MKTRIKQLGLILIALFIFSACNNAGKDKNVIKIGVILPMTGKLALMGEFEKNAFQLALDEVNSKEKKVEIIFEDGKGNPKDAVNAAKKLLDIDQVDLVITSTTGSSLAVQPIVTEKKKNMIAFCMDPDIAKKSEYVTRYYIGIDEEATAITNYFNLNNKSNISVGILYGKVPVWDKVVNQTFEPFFKSKNIPIAYKESYELNEKDFNSLIFKMKEKKITHLILLGYGFEYQNIFKSLEENKVLESLKIIGGWGFLYTSVNKKLLEGVLVSGPDYVYQNKDIAVKFNTDYRNKYKSDPNFDAAFAYNVILSLCENFKKENLLLPIKYSLARKGKFKGVIGNYFFNSDGNMIVETNLGIYKNGNIVSKEK